MASRADNNDAEVEMHDSVGKMVIVGAAIVKESKS